MAKEHPHLLSALPLVLALVVSGFLVNRYIQERALHALPKGFTKFNLSDPVPSCGRWKEHMPATRDPAAYQLYIEGRKIWRSKIGWQLSREETTRILTDVSEAADTGDWGAQALMAHFYLYGLGVLESNHVLDPAPEKAIQIQRMAANAGQPWGLYDLGVAYEHGYGSVPIDEDIAWAYYLRAAQLGSPDAQMALASAYKRAGRLADEGTMQRCAYLQGHGAAAYELGMSAKVEGRLDEAIHTFQEGVKLGDSKCASVLWLLFDGQHSTTTNNRQGTALKLLGLSADPARSMRYRALTEALEQNPDLRLDRLDKVLPLPPAPLPLWTGIEDAISPEPSGPPTY